MKTSILIFMFIGSYAGSYLPTLWGAGFFSLSSIILGGVGGFAGIWLGYRIALSIGLS